MDGRLGGALDLAWPQAWLWPLSGPTATAGAWNASSASGILTVSGAPGEANALAVADGDPGSFVISDDRNAFSGAAPAGCAPIDDGSGAPVTSLACDPHAIGTVVFQA